MIYIAITYLILFNICFKSNEPTDLPTEKRQTDRLKCYKAAMFNYNFFSCHSNRNWRPKSFWVLDLCRLRILKTLNSRIEKVNQNSKDLEKIKKVFDTFQISTI